MRVICVVRSFQVAGGKLLTEEIITRNLNINKTLTQSCITCQKICRHIRQKTLYYSQQPMAQNKIQDHLFQNDNSLNPGHGTQNQITS